MRFGQPIAKAVMAASVMMAVSARDAEEEDVNRFDPETRRGRARAGLRLSPVPHEVSMREKNSSVLAAASEE